MMKKLLLCTLLTFSTLIHAEETAVCKNKNLLDNLARNSVFVAEDDLNLVYVEKNSIEYDKTKKQARVWVIQYATQKWQQQATTQLGEKYKNFGIVKQLDVFDLKNNKYQTIEYALYNCSGDVLYTNKAGENSQFNDIVPNSAIDGVQKYLKTFYK